jgi:ABC-type transport system involved in cytochrome c biogenesis permease subunit
MWNLTRQQRRVLGAVLLLLLVGWAVQAWRRAHPPAPAPVTAEP